jgi:ABC-type Mn2+/Zn2+ transport system permease subunit
MTIVDSIISRLTQFSSWLFSRHWERWELLTIAIVALFLLLLVLRARRKAKINTTRYMPRYTPTIGIRLAHRGAKH